MEVAVFPTSADIANYIVFGEGLSMGYQGMPVFFTIQTRDQFGNNITDGGEVFSFEMAREGVSYADDITHTDNADGTYTVRYVVHLPGTYNLTILAGLSAEPLGSFSVSISPGLRASDLDCRLPPTDSV